MEWEPEGWMALGALRYGGAFASKPFFADESAYAPIALEQARALISEHRMAVVDYDAREIRPGVWRWVLATPRVVGSKVNDPADRRCVAFEAPGLDWMRQRLPVDTEREAIEAATGQPGAPPPRTMRRL